ncbi:MAG: S-layer homology domain-containing protein [Bacillus subtilis]|nr:S-layer homology domain-containing protein [Bacillus subtilis]
MVAKKDGAFIVAASVLVCGFSDGLTTGQAAYAITSVDELADVNQNHLAFNALKDLVERYNVIEGYPDRTFRGEEQLLAMNWQPRWMRQLNPWAESLQD